MPQAQIALIGLQNWATNFSSTNPCCPFDFGQDHDFNTTNWLGIELNDDAKQATSNGAAQTSELYYHLHEFKSCANVIGFLQPIPNSSQDPSLQATLFAATAAAITHAEINASKMLIILSSLK